MENKIVTMVNERLLAAMEKGIVPWAKCWDVSGIRNQNFRSRRPYSGINAIMTGLQGFASPYWLTFKEVSDMGGRIKKGEHGTPIVYWNFLSIDTDKVDDDGKPILKEVPYLRYYTVFNAVQIEGIEFTVPEEVKGSFTTSCETAKKLFSAYVEREKITLSEGGDNASYSPALDRIALPLVAQFHDDAGYYGTAFHEAVHSTGAKSRLNRDTCVALAAFGSKTYSREELVAEIGASYMVNLSGLEPHYDNMAAYLKGWMEGLRVDKMLFITAASRAEAAADFILNGKAA